jgi:hypothetical protein
MDHGLISHKGRGLSANIAGIFLARNYFSTGNSVDLVHHLWTERRGSGPWCTEVALIRGCDSARAHRWSPAVVEGGEPDEAVPEGCSPEHERRRRGGAMAMKTGGGLSSLQG